MKSIKLLKLFFVLFLFQPFIIEAQTWNVNSDFWSATDALGRKTPSESEVGTVRNGKYVGIFYFTWHTDNLAAFSPVINISQTLKQDPGSAYNLNDPAWGGIIDGGVYWWDEPLFGYYRTTDDWVLRKQAQMLANAGIDVAFFDCTNSNLTYQSAWSELLKVWEQARIDGVKTPQIAFILNFSATQTSLEEITQLYTDLYQPGLYKDLWFMWNGKPLIMAYPEMLVAQSNSAGLLFKADSSFIGVDAFCPSYSNNIGNLTLKLYKWNESYSATVAQTAIAESTFVNFNDNTRLKINFPQQPAGTYYWELNNATEVVGVWAWNNSLSPVEDYLNGTIVYNGNYDSKIYYADSTVANLTYDNGHGHTAVQIPPGVNSTLVDSIKNFFTFRPGQPDYVTGPTRNDQWGWLENYPQHGFGPKTGGGYEQVTVGIAQNASSTSGGHASAFNEPITYGRSYTSANGQSSDTSAYLYGANFQEQWSRAFQLDPDLVFVTGWNEWIAGRWDVTLWPNAYAPFSFVDEYDAEKSRDIEPVKSWGDKADVYYIQLINNVRKFKGMQVQPAASAPMTISMGKFNDWANVQPQFLDYKGDVIQRNSPGQGDSLVYTNTSGRNDIVLAKVTRDTSYIYFYVETADSLTPKTGPNWMRLWIDIDRDKTTGWEGYDYVINRVSPGDSAVIEKSVNNGWNWTQIGSAEYAISGKALELKVNRSVFNMQGKKLNFEFKWSDNNETNGDIMDFYVNGDAAPDGRFNYVYTDSITGTTGINKNENQLKSFSLSQNYPNPFNPSTEIKYSIPKSGLVTLKVYNILGQEVATLVNQGQQSGSYTVNFDASRLASGIYMYRIQAGNFSQTKKMTLLK
jgi:hypothetical protein